MKTTVVGMLLSCLAMSLYGASCAPKRAEELDKLGTVHLSIKGQPFELWIADGVSEQTQGLMFVSAERMAPLPDGTQRGMIFAFEPNACRGNNRVNIGGTILVTEIGCEELNRLPNEMHVVQ